MRQFAHDRVDALCFCSRNARYELNDVTAICFDRAIGNHEHADADCGWHLFAAGQVLGKVFADFTGDELYGADVGLPQPEIAGNRESSFLADCTGYVELAVARLRDVGPRVGNQAAHFAIAGCRSEQ